MSLSGCACSVTVVGMVYKYVRLEVRYLLNRHDGSHAGRCSNNRDLDACRFRSEMVN